MKRNRQVKFGVFVCQCGCGQEFTAEYITRKPIYMDNKHRNKVLARNKAVAREKRHKELFAAYKQKRKEIMKARREGRFDAISTENLKQKDFEALIDLVLPHFDVKGIDLND